LIGNSVGSWLSTFGRHNFQLVGRRLAMYSAILLGAVLCINVLTLLLDKFSIVEIPSYLFALGKKYPPGPSYVLLFGSAAVLLVGGMLMLSESRQSSPLYTVTACIGRNAFPILVVQYFLYYSGLFLFVTQVYKPPFLVAIVLFISSLLAIIWLGRIFDRIRVNRFWTVGLPSLVYGWSKLNFLSGKSLFRKVRSESRPKAA
jgi:hypothetical protein